MTDRAEIVGLALNGRPPREIAAQLGVEPTRIYNTLAEERRKGVAIPRFKGGSPNVYYNRVHIAPAVLHAFEPAACARQMTRHELAAELLTVLARDPGLVDAVLDDGVSA